MQKKFLLFLVFWKIVFPQFDYFFPPKVSLHIDGGLSHPEFDTGWYMELGTNCGFALDVPLRNDNPYWRIFLRVQYQHFSVADAAWGESIVSGATIVRRKFLSPLLFIGDNWFVDAGFGMNEKRWSKEEWVDKPQKDIFGQLGFGVEWVFSFYWGMEMMATSSISRVKVPHSIDEDEETNLHGDVSLSFGFVYHIY